MRLLGFFAALHLTDDDGNTYIVEDFLTVDRVSGTPEVNIPALLDVVQEAELQKMARG
jgi:hypothetical protein